MSQFKYLGVWFSDKVNLKEAADCFVGSVFAGWKEVLNIVRRFGVREVPHAMLFLIQTFVLPRALYSSQVWGVDFLNIKSCFTSKLQKCMMGIYKHVLGVDRSVRSDCLLDEVGAKHLQFYWLKSCITFWNKSMDSSNRILRDVCFLDTRLSLRRGTTWTAKLQKALKQLTVDNDTTYDQHLSYEGNLCSLNIPKVLDDWQ